VQTGGGGGGGCLLLIIVLVEVLAFVDVLIGVGVGVFFGIISPASSSSSSSPESWSYERRYRSLCAVRLTTERTICVSRTMTRGPRGRELETANKVRARKKLNQKKGKTTILLAPSDAPSERAPAGGE
jgi:hypothetical protein